MILGFPPQITRMRAFQQQEQPQQQPMQGQFPARSPLLASLASQSAQPLPTQASPLADTNSMMQRAMISRALARPADGDDPRSLSTPAIQPTDGLDRGQGGEGAGPNPGGGQLGSAGSGPGKAAADIGMGLIGGGIAPGFGSLAGIASALTGGQSNVMGFDLNSGSFGSPASPLGTMTARDVNTQPSSYGLSGLAPGDLSAIDATSKAAGTAVQTGDPSYGGGVGAGANDASGPGGIGGIGGGSGGVGGVGGGAGDFGGVMAKGGIVPGIGNRDTVPEMMTPGEGVLTKQAMSVLTPQRLMLLNALASGGAR